MGDAQRTPEGPISSVPEPAWERRFVLGLRATVQRSPAIEWYVGVLVADHAAEVAAPYVLAAGALCRALGMAGPQAAQELDPPVRGRYTLRTGWKAGESQAGRWTVPRPRRQWLGSSAARRDVDDAREWLRAQGVEPGFRGGVGTAGSL